MTKPEPIAASPTFHIPSLDGVRAIAVLAVFVGHGHVAPSGWPGHVGVTIFFFLSGYLITTLLRREYTRTGTVSLSKFYLRRALRILPPAYLAVAVSILLAFTGVLASNVSLTGVLAELFSFTNYYIVLAGRDGLPPETTQFWSLAVEEHYYLVIPAVLLVLFRRRLPMKSVGVILLAVAFLVPMWRVYLGLTGSGFDRLYTSTDTRIDSLLFGSAMALLLNPALGDTLPGGERTARWISAWIAPLAAVIFIGSAVVPSQHFRLSVADVVQCACLVPIFWHIITKRQSLAGRLLNHRTLDHIGKVSFSVYLFHRMVLAVAEQLIEVPVFMDITSLVVTLAIAEIVYRLVEKPCGNLRKKLESRRPATRRIPEKA
jgi:peptidoglycan/LPS O-acetylase OafA/YrhL